MASPLGHEGRKWLGWAHPRQGLELSHLGSKKTELPCVATDHPLPPLPSLFSSPHIPSFHLFLPLPSLEEGLPEDP